MIDANYDIIANGKHYGSIKEAVDDYVKDKVGTGISPKKMDRILKAVNLDIFENLTHGLTYLKSAVEPLSPRTIAKKGHDIPFLDEGILWRNVKDKMLNELHGIVFIGDEDKRDVIAERLNRGFTTSDGAPVPKREFFGLSDIVLNEIDLILESDD